VLVEAVQAECAERDGRHVWPEDPGEAEVGPEEGVQEGGDGLYGDGEGDDEGPLADREGG